MRYHITTQLSEHMSQTPEGYLLCRDVPIARTGSLEYAEEEAPSGLAPKGQAKGTVLLHRDAETLFAPETMASFEGKPLTIDHPEDFLGPQNWREQAMGHVQNVHRGAGAEDDLMLADILIMDARAIDLVLDGQREISCGYDADCEAVRPGVGRQVNIVGNHVALVERGRCGSRCAIKDAEKSMKKQGFFDKLLGNAKVRRAMRDAEEEMKAGDEDAPEKAKTEDNEQPPATDTADLTAKMDEMILLLRTLVEGAQPKTDSAEGACDEETQTADEDDPQGAEKTEDEDTSTTDEDAPTKTADADTLRRASALAPALRFRAGDSARLVQRAALRQAMGDGAVARTVTACLGHHTVDTAPVALLNAAFVAASAVAGRSNSQRTADALTQAKGKDSAAKVSNPASINALNRDFYRKA